MHFVFPNVTYFCICEQIQVGANILKRNDSWSAKFYPPRAFILSPDAHLWVGAVGALKQHLLLRIRGLEISWTFLQCVFSGVSSKCLHRMICSHSGCILFYFSALHWCTSRIGTCHTKTASVIEDQRPRKNFQPGRECLHSTECHLSS